MKKLVKKHLVSKLYVTKLCTLIFHFQGEVIKGTTIETGIFVEVLNNSLLSKKHPEFPVITFIQSLNIEIACTALQFALTDESFTIGKQYKRDLFI